MADDTMSDRLKHLWEEGRRHMAVDFLRRALTPETTLAEIDAVLKFDAVRSALSAVRLRDVLDFDGAAAAPPGVAPAASHAAPVAQASPAALPVRPRQPAPGRTRTRRGPREMQMIKDLVLEMVRAEADQMDTNQVEEGLGRQGHRIDRITLNRLLSSLEQDGHLACLGGRPKAWRASGGDEVRSAG